MLAGVASALGRLGTPLLSDAIGRERAALASISLTALGAFSLAFLQGAAFMAMAAIVAFCYGGFSGVYPVIVGERFGLRHLGAVYGAVMVGFALSALLFPMLLGLFESATAKFMILGAMAVAGAGLMLLLHVRRKQ
jgi:OFA family oxalate/formate antiporter-like MFS transporter